MPCPPTAFDLLPSRRAAAWAHSRPALRQGSATPLFRRGSRADPVFSRPRGRRPGLAAAEAVARSYPEFMKDPSVVTDTKGEWIEVWNSLAWRCTSTAVRSSERRVAVHHTLSSGGTTSLSCARPGECSLRAGDQRRSAQNVGVTANSLYSCFTLSNTSPDHPAQSERPTVDRRRYRQRELSELAGASIQLKRASATSTKRLSDDWCSSPSH